MKWRARVVLYFSAFLAVVCSVSGVSVAGGTRVDLREPDSGREIFSGVLQDGERAVLTWKNSLYGLHVTEVFEASGGALVLTEVTYALPEGPPPPVVPPQDVPGLYQTGGPFSARGLTQSFREVVYRVGEIGEPHLKIRGRIVDFKREVGFGGRIRLTAGSASQP